MRSEDTVLALINKELPPSRAMVSRGDDAAVLDVEGPIVVSTDVLVDGVHFRRDYSTAADIGYRCVAQNVADSAAMGAQPVSLVIAVTTPPDISDDWMADMARGLAEAGEDFGVDIDGGDLSSGSIVTLCGTVIGDLHGRSPVCRTGANIGDYVVHCGHLGLAARGLEDIEAGIESEYAELYRRPQPPIQMVIGAPVTAMMDVSDSLVRDGTRLAEASGVCVDLDWAKIQQLLRPGITRHHALFGGEDHGFIATTADVKPGWTVIGTVKEGRGLVIDGETVQDESWDHYRKS